MPTKTQFGKNAPEGLTRETLLPGHGDTLPLDLETHKGLGPVGQFITDTFKHFNAATLHEAAEAYCALIDKGGKMFLAMAGAMSTGELGITLAEMIRKGKVHAICCTGANLEEDVFNLVAHSKYLRIPGYRDLTPDDEELLLENELPRVTDTAIPEKAAMKLIEDVVAEYWEEADAGGLSYFPHEYLYRALRSGSLEDHYEIDPKHSWMLAAAEKELPIFVPGWEDSTLGNMFASMILKEKIHGPECVKGGIAYMLELCKWYKKEAKGAGVGFFQIGGGIAGDFPICAVPLLKIDMGMDDKVPYWSYFVQISDSTTSYGSYSGAVPNEKITWAKLQPETPRFVIESDAAIVAPLIFAYVLGK
jgi:deoxyhypusine synthase